MADLTFLVLGWYSVLMSNLSFPFYFVHTSFIYKISISYESTRAWNYSWTKSSQNRQKTTKEQKMMPNSRGIIIMSGIQFLWSELCSSSGTVCVLCQFRRCSSTAQQGWAPNHSKWSRHFSYLVYNLLIPKIMFSRSRLMSVIHLVSPEVDLQMNSWIVLAWRHIDTEVVRSTTHIPTWIATLLLFVFLNL